MLSLTARIAWLAAGTVLAATAAAQSREGHGIAGFWSRPFGPLPPRRDPTPTEAALLAEFPEGTVLLGDSGASNSRPVTTAV